MSTNVTYVGTVYRVPAYQDTGYAQGSGNLSSYLIALATGSLTLSGGTFTLTADVDFGANFGLKSIYYKSRSANPALTGVIRLGSTEVIAWRNNAHGGDLPLTTNSSDSLLYNGTVFITTGGNLVVSNGTPKAFIYCDANKVVSSTAAVANGELLIGSNAAVPVKTTLTGTANQVVVTNGAGSITLSTPQSIDVAATPTFASLTLTSVTNQLILGTTRTVTVSAPTPASSSRVFTIPDLGGDYSVVGTIGTQTIAGAKTFSSAIAISATSNHLVLSTATNTLTINANTQVTARVWSVPDISSAGTFAALEGAQTFSGAKTFSGGITMSGSTIAMGSQKITGLSNGTAATDAAAFGQVKVLQVVTATSTTVATTTSATYAATSLTATITPTSASNRILIIATGTLKSSAIATDNAYATLFRAGSNILGASGGATISSNGVFNIEVPASLSFVDSPATTSSTTYAVAIKSDGGGSTVSWGITNLTQSITLIEIV